MASSSATGVEAALAVPFPFFLGGIFTCEVDCLVGLNVEVAAFANCFSTAIIKRRERAAISKIASVRKVTRLNTMQAWTTTMKEILV